MKNFLSWMVAGALVASVGGVSVANSTSTDSFIPIQDPPEMSMGTLSQGFGDSGTTVVVDRLLPTASTAVLRDGFTNNATSNDIETRTEFDVSSANTTTSNDARRVAPSDDSNSSPTYRHTVTVQTNGASMSIKRVGYCVINSQDADVISADSFRYGDVPEGGGGAADVVTNDVERNCGFNDDYPTSEGQPDTQSAALSLVFKPENISTNNGFAQIVASGSAANELKSGLSSASWDDTTSSWTVTFAFRPSPAFAKQSTGWIIRAAAQDQAPSVDGNTFVPQVSQIFYSTVEPDNHVEGEFTESSASFDVFRQVSVGYYGAIITERESATYGTLRKLESGTADGIRTGKYLANAASDIIIDATEFASSLDSSRTLSYTDKSPEEGEVFFQCEFASTYTGSSNPVTVDTSANDLKTGLAASIDTSNDDTPKEIRDGGMSCQLTYGGGAEDAGEDYVNEVTLSIRDASTAIPSLVP